MERSWGGTAVYQQSTSASVDTIQEQRTIQYMYRTGMSVECLHTDLCFLEERCVHGVQLIRAVESDVGDVPLDRHAERRERAEVKHLQTASLRGQAL